MVQAFPHYDCQRSFDRRGGVNYIVPALWMCREPRGDDGIPPYSFYLELLSELRFTKARCVFASEDFRSVLDGQFADMYRGASLAAAEDVRCEDGRDSGR